jgi:D-serine dehydratase
VPLDLQPILREVIDDRTKGFPHGHAPAPLEAFGAQRWNVLRGDLPFPLAVIKNSALSHNAQWMRRFTAEHGVRLAPHGKTTMCPQIFERQIDAGAWGITVATVHQLGICVGVGVKRVIMANQLVSRLDVARVVALCNRDVDLELYFLVDSLRQLELVATAAESCRPARPLNALLELGLAGGRTGVRSADDALAVARGIAAAPSIALAGIECYEGLTITGDAERDARHVGAFLAFVKSVAATCDAERLFQRDTIIVSAGGSAVFDIVARELPMRLSRPVQTILRSGCYVTHDNGLYERMWRGIEQRGGGRLPANEGLRPALELWAQVQSRPEPALAILTMGKRDVSYDVDMPRPVAWYRTAFGDAPRTASERWRITKLNDQHAYLELPPDADLDVGDLVGCGISHPCTTFDKWPLLFEVEDTYDVVGGLRTFF